MLIFSTFVWTISHCRKNSARYCHNLKTIRVNYQLLFLDFKLNMTFCQISDRNEDRLTRHLIRKLSSLYRERQSNDMIFRDMFQTVAFFGAFMNVRFSGFWITRTNIIYALQLKSKDAFLHLCSSLNKN